MLRHEEIQLNPQRLFGKSDGRGFCLACFSSDVSYKDLQALFKHKGCSYFLCLNRRLEASLLCMGS